MKDKQHLIRRRDPPRKGSYYRVPEIGPVTPRLREAARIEAIGFHHDFIDLEDRKREDRES